jgi:hypothetical protein
LNSSNSMKNQGWTRLLRKGRQPGVNFTNVITEHYIYIWYSRFVIGRFASMNTNSYSKVFWPPAVGQYDLLCLISEIRWTSSKLNFIYLWCIGGLEYHLYFVLFCICFRYMLEWQEYLITGWRRQLVGFELY